MEPSPFTLKMSDKDFIGKKIRRPILGYEFPIVAVLFPDLTPNLVPVLLK